MFLCFVGLSVVGESKVISCGSEINVMTVGVYNSISCNSVCSSFSIVPALPTGILFENNTIHGTPVESSSLLTYTISCSGSYGSFSLGSSCSF